MIWFLITLLAPLLGGLILSAPIEPRLAGRLNVLTGAVSFAGSIGLSLTVLNEGSFEEFQRFFFLDSFNVFLVALTCFVAMTTSIFSGPYMLHELEKGRFSQKQLRLYHSMYQLFVFGMLLGFTTNNIGVMWISLELATLATVLTVSLYRTPNSIAAAWKYFVLAGMGIALALFGTTLIFFTSSSVLGHGNEAMTWTLLMQSTDKLDPSIMMMAFAFLMVGYGTKVGLAPMHAWLPDAHGEGPTPISAVLSGLLLNLALYVLVRFKMLVDGAAHNEVAGHMMIAFGLISLLTAAFSLHRQKDIKRLYSFSSIEHMGLISLAFGIGGVLANFAALLHMTTHSLVKSGIFVTVGHAAQQMGTQKMKNIRGLIRHHPGTGWGLLIGTLAIAGFPPFGIFASEFMLMAAVIDLHPILLPLLLAGLLIAFAGLLRFVQPMVFGDVPEKAHKVSVNMLPVYVHLFLALLLGLAIPVFLADWYDHAARLIAFGGNG